MQSINLIKGFHLRRLTTTRPHHIVRKLHYNQLARSLLSLRKPKETFSENDQLLAQINWSMNSRSSFCSTPTTSDGTTTNEMFKAKKGDIIRDLSQELDALGLATTAEDEATFVQDTDYANADRLLIETDVRALAMKDSYDEKKIHRRYEGTLGNSPKEPHLVPSVFHERIVGCVCEMDQPSIEWMLLKLDDQPTQCLCGYWFRLVPAKT